MYYGETNQHKERIIVKWIHSEITSERFKYEIFLEYNPDYPNTVNRYINQLLGDTQE
jgi:hypothetical protein